MNMHIGYFQSGFPVPDGTTTAVHGLALGLARRGLRVTIYGCGPEDELHRLASHSNLRVQIFPGPSLRGFSVRHALTGRIAANADGLDLFVINTMFNPPCISIGKAARKGGIPYLVSPHDPYHPELLKKNWLRKRLYMTLFEGPLLKKAAAVQVLSAEHARWLNRFGVRTAVVIPNGFYPDEAEDGSETATTRLDVQLYGDPRFLCLGRLDAHHKGLDLVIRGFASAMRAGLLPQSATVNFVGRGAGDVEMLKRIAANEGVAEQVKFLGEVSDQTRRTMLRDCDTLLLCSRYDGFGLVVLEAMLRAKPVVVSREAGIAASVERAGAGIIAEPSVTGIRAALAECMSRRSEWTTLGANGKSYAHQYMTWDRIADHAAECYRQLTDTLQHAPPARKTMRVIGIQTNDSQAKPVTQTQAVAEGS